MDYNNYYPDVNRFKLSGPPEFWLKKLYHFDASLVVVPSRQSCLYRLAQRRKLSLPEHITNDALFNESDTQMLASYSLIPVTTIIPTANWSNDYMFEELRRRAPHRNGGAEKVIAEIEAQEMKDELDQRAAVDDITTQTAKDGWGLYLKKLGVRSHMYIPKSKPKVDRSINKAPMIIIP